MARQRGITASRAGDAEDAEIAATAEQETTLKASLEAGLEASSKQTHATTNDAEDWLPEPLYCLNCADLSAATC